MTPGVVRGKNRGNCFSCNYIGKNILKTFSRTTGPKKAEIYMIAL
jgi:hypothetical protein